MNSLSGSAFLQALGWAIAGSLWQMALLWTIYQLCFGVWRNIGASLKTLAATLLQFAGFVWFLSSLVSHYWLIKMTPHTAALSGASYEGVSSGHSPLYYVNHALAWSEHYLPYLSGAYLLVLGFLLVRVFKAYRHVQAVRTEGLSRIDPQWRVYVQELAYRIGIRRDIRVWLSDRIDIPATMGYLKPLILLPIASFNHLSPEQVEAILLHELAHIKRHDYLLNLVITVVDTVLFFNPFAQLIGKHIRTERENSCDDFVLQFRYNPHVYASALLSLEQQRLSPELAMAAAGKTDLLDRIRRIMNVPAKPMNYGQKLMALLITAGILASLAWLTPENIEHKPMLNPMAALLPAAPPGVPNPAVEPPVEKAPVTPRVHVTHPCPATQAARESAAQADSWMENSTPDTDPVVSTDVAAAASPATLSSAGAEAETDRAFKIVDQSLQLAKMAQLHADSLTFFKGMKLKSMNFNLLLDSVKIKGITFQQQAFKKALLDSRRAYTVDQKALLEEREVYIRGQKLQRDEVIKAFKLQDQLMCQQQQDQETRNMERRKAEQVLRDINRKLENAERMVTLATRTKIKAKVLDQLSDDEEAGISADQPGWQAPAQLATAQARWASLPVSYRIMPDAVKHKEATMYASTTAAYRERITLYKLRAAPHRTAPQDVFIASSEGEQPVRKEKSQNPAVTSLVDKLETDGFLNESGNVRIVLDNNALIINGQTQPDVVYTRYRDCLNGKAVVVLATGKVIQVTVH